MPGGGNRGTEAADRFLGLSFLLDPLHPGRQPAVSVFFNAAKGLTPGAWGQVGESYSPDFSRI